MNNKSLIAIIFIFALVIGFCFWPTIFRYEKMKIGNEEVPLRINRLTGSTEVWALTNWVQESKLGDPEALSEEELSKLTGNCSLEQGFFRGKIYNGSDFHLSSIEFRVCAWFDQGSVDELKDGSLFSLLEYASTDFWEFSDPEKEKIVNNVIKYADEVAFNFVTGVISNYLEMNEESKKQFKSEIWDACKTKNIIAFLKKFNLRPLKAWNRLFAVAKNFKSFSTTEFVIQAATNKHEKPFNSNWKIVSAKGYRKGK